MKKGVFLSFLIAVMCFFVQSSVLSLDTVVGEDTLDLSNSDADLFISSLLIPKESGTISQRVLGSSKKTVVYIQDIHCHFEAQKNQAQIISYLKKHYGIDLILVEGGMGDVGLSHLRKYASQDIREKVSNDFLKQGKISGEEYLDIVSLERFCLEGIENEDSYRENFLAFKKLEKIRKKIAPSLDAMIIVSEALKKKLFPQEMLVIEKKKQEYLEGKLSLVEYCRKLKELAGKREIDFLQYRTIMTLLEAAHLENNIDSNILDKEISILLKQLEKKLSPTELKELVANALRAKVKPEYTPAFYRTLIQYATQFHLIKKQYKHITDYGQSITLADSIDPMMLTKECNELEELMRNSYLITHEQQTLAAIDYNIGLCKKLISSCLTSLEFNHFKKTYSQYRVVPWLTFLKEKNDQYKLNCILPEKLPLTFGMMHDLDAFYAAAGKRDDVFMNNIVTVMDEKEKNCAVLITGGFHAANLTRLLKQKDFSYAVISPKISENGGDDVYKKALDYKQITQYTLRPRATRGTPVELELKIALEKSSLHTKAGTIDKATISSFYDKAMMLLRHQKDFMKRIDFTSEIIIFGLFLGYDFILKQIKKEPFDAKEIEEIYGFEGERITKVIRCYLPAFQKILQSLYFDFRLFRYKSGGFKNVGLPLHDKTLLIIKAKEKDWIVRSENVDVRKYRIIINDPKQKGKEKEVTIRAKVIFVGEELPQGVNAWGLGMGADENGEYIIVAVRGSPGDNRDHFDEMLYHESREVYWKEHDVSSREAHILASADQVLAFGKPGKLTAYHQDQLRFLLPEQLQSLLNEEREKSHHRIIEKHLTADDALVVEEYEKFIQRKAQERLYALWIKQLTEMVNEYEINEKMRIRLLLLERSLRQKDSLLAQECLTFIEDNLGKVHIETKDFDKIREIVEGLTSIADKTVDPHIELRIKSKEMLVKDLKRCSRAEKQELLEKVGEMEDIDIQNLTIEEDLPLILSSWYEITQVAGELGIHYRTLNKKKKRKQVTSFVRIKKHFRYHPEKVIKEYESMFENKAFLVSQSRLRTIIHSISIDELKRLSRFVREETGVVAITPDEVFKVCKDFYTVKSFSTYLGIDMRATKKLITSRSLEKGDIVLNGKVQFTLISPQSVLKIEEEREKFLKEVSVWCQENFPEDKQIVPHSFSEFRKWFSMEDLNELFPFVGSSKNVARIKNIKWYIPPEEYRHLIPLKYAIPLVEIERLKKEAVSWFRKENVLELLKKYNLIPKNLTPEDLDYDKNIRGVISTITQTWLRKETLIKKVNSKDSTVSRLAVEKKIDSIKFPLYFTGHWYPFFSPTSPVDFLELEKPYLEAGKLFLEETCGVPVPSLDMVKELLARHCMTSLKITNELAIPKVYPHKNITTVSIRFLGETQPRVYWKKEEAQAFITSELTKFKELLKRVSQYASAKLDHIKTIKDLMDFLQSQWKTVNEVAELVGVIPLTIKNRIKRGDYVAITADFAGYGKRLYVLPESFKQDVVVAMTIPKTNRDMYLNNYLGSCSEKEKLDLLKKVVEIEELVHLSVTVDDLYMLLRGWYDGIQLSQALQISENTIQKRRRKGDITSFVQVGRRLFYHPKKAINEYEEYVRNRSRVGSKRRFLGIINALPDKTVNKLTELIYSELGITILDRGTLFAVCSKWRTLKSLSEELGFNVDSLRDLIKNRKFPCFEIIYNAELRYLLIPPETVKKIQTEIDRFMLEVRSWYKTIFPEEEGTNPLSLKEFLSWPRIDELSNIFPFVGGKDNMKRNSTLKLFIPPKKYIYLVPIDYCLPPKGVEHLKREAISWFQIPSVFKLLKKHGLVEKKSRMIDLDYDAVLQIIAVIQADWLSRAEFIKRVKSNKDTVRRLVKEKKIDGVSFPVYFTKHHYTFFPRKIIKQFNAIDNPVLEKGKDFLEKVCEVYVPSLKEVKKLLQEHTMNAQQIARILGVSRVYPPKKIKTISLQFLGDAQACVYWAKHDGEAFIKKRKTKLAQTKVNNIVGDFANKPPGKVPSFFDSLAFLAWEVSVYRRLQQTEETELLKLYTSGNSYEKKIVCDVLQKTTKYLLLEILLDYIAKGKIDEKKKGLLFSCTAGYGAVVEEALEAYARRNSVLFSSNLKAGIHGHVKDVIKRHKNNNNSKRIKSAVKKIMEMRNNSHSQGFKHIGPPLTEEVVRKIMSNEKKWLKQSEKVIAVECVVPIKSREKKNKTKSVRIYTKIIHVGDELPNGVNAWLLGKGTDKVGEFIIVAVRGSSGDKIDHFYEILYHESREQFWKDRGVSPREAHIIASAEQMIAFADEGELTPFHKSQIAELPYKDLRYLLEEYQENERAFHHHVIKKHYTELEKLWNGNVLAKMEYYETLLAKHIIDNYSEFIQKHEISQEREGFFGVLKNSPLEMYFRQISLQYQDPLFNPSKRGYDKTKVLCQIISYGGLLPKGTYDLIYYDGNPLFLQVFDRTIIPLSWFNISYDKEGRNVGNIEKSMLKSIQVICNYFGYDSEAWNEEISYLYDFGPRWMSSEGCLKLGLQSLIVFQGVFSPLEDIGEDARYTNRIDNTIPEGIEAILDTVKPGKKLLIYKPGTGVEAIRAALGGIYVTVLCTSEIEKMNVECNALLNGVDATFLKVVEDLPEEEKCDFTYLNAPRPVFPEESELYKDFDKDTRKFDYKGEVTKEFLEIAKNALTKDGKVITIGYNIPVYHELIGKAGFNVEQFSKRRTFGDVGVLVLFKDVGKKDVPKRLNELFNASIDQKNTFLERKQVIARIREIYSVLSESVGAANIPANAYDYFGSTIFIPDRLLSYTLIDILLKTREFITSFANGLPASFKTLARKIDGLLLEYESRLSDSIWFSDTESVEGLENIAEGAFEMVGRRVGFFVKYEKLEWMLRLTPPRELMKEYRAESIDALLKRIDVVSIFMLARCLEGSEWHDKIISLYSLLEIQDFEERPITVLIFHRLPKRAMSYFEKKLPFSNDKITGSLTGFPIKSSSVNQVPRLRALSKALHYIHEILFYSDVIRSRVLNNVDDFKSLDVSFKESMGEIDITQFFEPHIMMEALVTEKGLRDMEESTLVAFPEELKGLPFTMAVQEGDKIEVTGVINRITPLSKGYGKIDDNVTRYMRVAPLMYYFEHIDVVRKMLVISSTFPQLISIAMQGGFSAWSILPVDSNELLADYPEKVLKYNNMIKAKNALDNGKNILNVIGELDILKNIVTRDNLEGYTGQIVGILQKIQSIISLKLTPKEYIKLIDMLSWWSQYIPKICTDLLHLIRGEFSVLLPRAIITTTQKGRYNNFFSNWLKDVLEKEEKISTFMEVGVSMNPTEHLSLVSFLKEKNQKLISLGLDILPVQDIAYEIIPIFDASLRIYCDKEGRILFGIDSTNQYVDIDDYRIKRFVSDHNSVIQNLQKELLQAEKRRNEYNLKGLYIREVGVQEIFNESLSQEQRENIFLRQGTFESLRYIKEVDVIAACNTLRNYLSCFAEDTIRSSLDSVEAALKEGGIFVEVNCSQEGETYIGIVSRKRGGSLALEEVVMDLFDPYYGFVEDSFFGTSRFDAIPMRLQTFFLNNMFPVSLKDELYVFSDIFNEFILYLRENSKEFEQYFLNRNFYRNITLMEKGYHALLEKLIDFFKIHGYDAYLDNRLLIHVRFSQDKIDANTQTILAKANDPEDTEYSLYSYEEIPWMEVLFEKVRDYYGSESPQWAKIGNTPFNFVCKNDDLIESSEPFFFLNGKIQDVRIGYIGKFQDRSGCFESLAAFYKIYLTLLKEDGHLDSSKITPVAELLFYHALRYEHTIGSGMHGVEIDETVKTILYDFYSVYGFTIKDAVFLFFMDSFGDTIINELEMIRQSQERPLKAA
ncbi:hypothetical protein ACFL1T_00580 [Chlamydiota bacterium]